MTEWLKPKDAAARLGISYPALKQWIYAKKIRSAKTPGGHHRISEAEIERLLPTERKATEPAPRERYRRISGRNQLVGKVLEVKFDGLLAQVKLSISGQVMTAIITAEAAREMRLKRGEAAAALVKSTEVMIVRP